MRIQGGFRTEKAGGYALLMTMGFVAISVALLATLTNWTFSEAALTSRNNLYTTSVSAAEAASELVIARMQRDFIYQSVNSDLDVYRNLTPDSSAWPVQFTFSDGSGHDNTTGVASLGAPVITNLNSQFQGLYGLVSSYRVTAAAKPLGRLYDPFATVVQDIQLAQIPVFQFAIFYTLDLEINPGPQMTINGKVHSNGSIYAAPVSGLTFQDSVTAVGSILNDRHPLDPQYGNGKVKPTYNSDHVEKASALTLPVGTNNTAEAVREILKRPPSYEDPNSPLGKERYYNKADLIVTTTSSGVTLKTGAWGHFQTIPPDKGTEYSFVNSSASFFDLRENKWTSTTQIDVAGLINWMQYTNIGQTVNSAATTTIGHQVNSIYVEDLRSSPSRLTVVRVVNGATLPAHGLTIATPQPLYVKGHFNLNNGSTTVGNTDTSQTKPASLVGDAITILSQNWNDNNASHSLSHRAAANTTVNAALLGGIVKTTLHSNNNKYYSGGVENFPRFLEDWSGRTLTYNGSMVVMFESEFATKFWQAPGNYYNAPTRRWAFDVNFLNQIKLPPGTPQVRKLVRGQWTVM